MLRVDQLLFEVVPRIVNAWTLDLTPLPRKSNFSAEFWVADSLVGKTVANGFAMVFQDGATPQIDLLETLSRCFHAF